MFIEKTDLDITNLYLKNTEKFMQARICFLLKCLNLLCYGTNDNDKLLNYGVLFRPAVNDRYCVYLECGGLFHCFQGALW